MSAFRRLRAWAFSHELDPDNIRAQLDAGAVPVSYAECRTCANPCEDGHGEYPTRFTVDMETQMLGTVDPFRRQVFISTGAKDWFPEITWSRQSLAAHITSVIQPTALPPPSTTTPGLPKVPGIFTAAESTHISVLNAHIKSISHDAEEMHTVLIFPDFVMVAGVPATREGARALWRAALDPRVPRVLGSVDSAEAGFSTWVLPYSCVLTFCSHARRDKRCGTSAPKLERAFTTALEARGWTVDTELEQLQLMQTKRTSWVRSATLSSLLTPVRVINTRSCAHRRSMRRNTSG
ncbi:hypothetical protein C8R46DRAFT_996405 [Mycena filopes]|nr:hypothetical protein C8R46DRAFT_996405 [Mycena filopes]